MLDEAVEEFVRVCQMDADLVARATLDDGTVDVDTLIQLVLTKTMFNGKDCFAYGRQCEYYELCQAEPDLRFGLLSDRFEYVAPTYFA